MLSRIKRYVPYSVKQVVKLVIESFSKTGFKYLELHLTDHCNLNCKGCYHFSSIAPSRHADINQHEHDMRRLKQLFGSIDTIRLMGGEPLLHPNPVPFITITKSIFPESDIRLVTNGILLPKASQAFWDACRDTATTIQLTVYPPIRNHVEKLRSLCNTQGVNLSLGEEIQVFDAQMNLKGDSDKQQAFNVCRSRHYCPFLQDGHLYTCRMPALIYHFNNRFGYQIVADAGINIHSRSASRERILQYLSRPIVTCKWCSHDFVPFPWSMSNLNQVPEDWDAKEHRKMTEPSSAAPHQDSHSGKAIPRK